MTKRSKLAQENELLMTYHQKSTAVQELQRLNQKKVTKLGEKECANCGFQGTCLSMCSRCKLSSYCCKACQLQDWGAVIGHKKFCVPIDERIPVKMSLSEIDAGMSSAICLEPLLAHSSSILTCPHVFHFECLSNSSIRVARSRKNARSRIWAF